MKKPGLIVVAYQGMGKTTLTKQNPNYFDLESSGYPRDNQEWYKNYVKDAIKKVTEEGYDICFLSSHEVVRDYLTTIKQPFLIFYPIAKKSTMLDRLAKRYFEDPSVKNGKALANAVLDYEKNVMDLMAYRNSIASKDGFIDNTLLEKLIKLPVEDRLKVMYVMASIKENKIKY